MRVFLIISGVVLAVLAVLVIAGSQDDGTPVSERIKRECAKMHPYDEIQANNCSIALMVRYLDDNKKSQMDSAYQRIR